MRFARILPSTDLFCFSLYMCNFSFANWVMLTVSRRLSLK